MHAWRPAPRKRQLSPRDRLRPWSHSQITAMKTWLGYTGVSTFGQQSLLQISFKKTPLVLGGSPYLPTGSMWVVQCPAYTTCSASREHQRFCGPNCPLCADGGAFRGAFREVAFGMDSAVRGEGCSDGSKGVDAQLRWTWAWGTPG